MSNDGAVHADEAVRECRALTIAARPEEDRRPMAGFVAQLIACDRRLGAFRRARREEPAGAAIAYGSGADRPLTHLAVDVKV